MTDPDTTQGQSDESKKVEITEAELKALQEKASALETRLQAAEIERVRLEERAKAQEPKKPEGPVRLTHAQLQEAVDEGKITESDMQAELARQMREDLKTEIKADITAKLEAKEAARKIQDQFDGYLRLRPGVKTEGHEDRIAVQKEFQDLVALGYSPQEKRTEVLAMRNVFGPLDRIQETTRERREVYQETSGGGGGGRREASTAKDWHKGLTQNQIRDFETDLSKGNYKSEDDKMFLGVVTRARTNNAKKGKAA